MSVWMLMGGGNIAGSGCGEAVIVSKVKCDKGTCKESVWKPVHKQVKLEKPHEEDSSAMSDA